MSRDIGQHMPVTPTPTPVQPAIEYGGSALSAYRATIDHIRTSLAAGVTPDERIILIGLSVMAERCRTDQQKPNAALGLLTHRVMAAWNKVPR